MFLTVYVNLLLVGLVVYGLERWQRSMQQHRLATRLLQVCAVLIFIAVVWHSYNAEQQKEQWKLEPATKIQIE